MNYIFLVPDEILYNIIKFCDLVTISYMYITHKRFQKSTRWNSSNKIVKIAIKKQDICQIKYLMSYDYQLNIIKNIKYILETDNKEFVSTLLCLENLTPLFFNHILTNDKIVSQIIKLGPSSVINKLSTHIDQCTYYYHLLLFSRTDIIYSTPSIQISTMLSCVNNTIMDPDSINYLVSINYEITLDHVINILENGKIHQLKFVLTILQQSVLTQFYTFLKNREYTIRSSKIVQWLIDEKYIPREIIIPMYEHAYKKEFSRISRISKEVVLNMAKNNDFSLYNIYIDTYSVFDIRYKTKILFYSAYHNNKSIFIRKMNTADYSYDVIKLIYDISGGSFKKFYKIYYEYDIDTILLLDCVNKHSDDFDKLYALLNNQSLYKLSIFIKLYKKNVYMAQKLLNENLNCFININPKDKKFCCQTNDIPLILLLSNESNLLTYLLLFSSRITVKTIFKMIDANEIQIELRSSDKLLLNIFGKSIFQAEWLYKNSSISFSSFKEDELILKFYNWIISKNPQINNIEYVAVSDNITYYKYFMSVDPDGIYSYTKENILTLLMHRSFRILEYYASKYKLTIPFCSPCCTFLQKYIDENEQFESSIIQLCQHCEELIYSKNNCLSEFCAIYKKYST